MKNPHDQLPFSILGIDHIGMVPKDVEQAAKFFQDVLKLPGQGEEEVSEQGVHTFMFASAHSPEATVDRGRGRLELLKSIDPQGPIAKFIQTKGSGIHHLAIRVNPIDAAIAYLQKQGVQMVDTQARRGAHRTKVAFIHPRATGGILVELVEPID